ncbi:hypothetical protein [Roseospira goensis]|uniref:Uncharacterized protein n=1 Tax=Roseospira goensis TaxID=391922 RepID=A0A7W6S253_9PROT|nr:hypothetical protein [Roseospira goensis]MBB4287508.1 hypothetical protein [Roseospira goensis]
MTARLIVTQDRPGAPLILSVYRPDTLEPAAVVPMTATRAVALAADLLALARHDITDHPKET